MLIVSRHMLFRYLKEDSVSGHRWTLFTSQAIQWWRSVPGRRRPPVPRAITTSQWLPRARLVLPELTCMLAHRWCLCLRKSTLHTHPVAIQFANWQPRLARFKCMGLCFAPCDANGLNFRWQGSSMMVPFFFLTLLITASNSCCY